MVFAAQRPGRYLYFGNPSAPQFQYDFPAYAARLREEGVTAAKLAAIGPAPGFSPHPPPQPPWSERHKHLLWLALLAVLAMLGGIIWRQAKSLPPSNGDREGAG